MAHLQPFKGIRFNPASITAVGDVITPPYDVIDSDEQDRLHKKNPYNIIRLEYGKEYSTDNDQDNRYSRAESALRQWLEDDILEPDREPCYYLYEQIYTYNSASYSRRGVIAALRVAEYSEKIVLPHELTMSAPKADRMELLSRLRTNISPIFTLFPDPDQRMDQYFAAVRNTRPLVEAAEDSGQRHRLWALSDQDLQRDLTSYLAPQPLLIADGHHRYETALAYSRSSRDTESPGKNYVLAALVSMKDPGLLILPTHRLVRELTGLQEKLLDEVISGRFDYSDYGPLNGMNSEDYLHKLSLSGSSSSIGLIKDGRAGYLKPKYDQLTEKLPVALLHEQILKPVLAPDEKSEVDKSMLSYPHDLEAAIEALISGQARVGFILEPIQVEEILKRAEKGEVMPQKSTFFYPKLPSGLVMHHHRLSY
ncbi:MAG: DUF1015 domain-containing protein [Firmicutes bacterium]|nr:DUF1015 domain-containing protein [Bacillota bacterium]